MLPVLEIALNNSYQHSIKDTLFYANYGKHPCIMMISSVKASPVESLNHMISRSTSRGLWSIHKTCLRNVQHCQKKHGDARHRDLQFKVGDRLWLSSKNIPIADIGA